MRDACSARAVIGRDQLLSLYSKAPPTVDVVDRVRSLGLWTLCCMRLLQCPTSVDLPPTRRIDRAFLRRYRGRRSGRRSRRRKLVLRPVGNGASIVVENCQIQPQKNTSAGKRRVQCALKTVSSLKASPKETPPIKVGVLNAQSVGNKSADVCDWISDNALLLAAVVETWHDGNDTPTLVACAPPGYRYVQLARPRPDGSSLGTNHGGVCLFHDDKLHVRPVSLPAYTVSQVS